MTEHNDLLDLLASGLTWVADDQASFVQHGHQVLVRVWTEGVPAREWAAAHGGEHCVTCLNGDDMLAWLAGSGYGLMLIANGDELVVYPADVAVYAGMAGIGTRWV